MGRDLPRGTVTFLFTDIEGSTRLLKELRDRYGAVLADHQRLLRAAFEEAGGEEIDTQGDSFFVAFRRAKDAVGAAIAGQRALAAQRWPKGAAVRVRMGLHTGEPAVGDDRYVGMGVHKAARIAAAAHGGQILLSNTTRGLVEDELPPDVRLVDHGEQRLKDIDLPERIFQLDAAGLKHRFPPLRMEAPLPRARVWQGRGTGRPRRALVGVVAILALAGLAAGLAFALTDAGRGPGSFSKAKQGRVVEPGDDPNTIVAGTSIGAVKLGMSESAVKALYGGGNEVQWQARGRSGDRIVYSGTGGSLTASFYDDKVVQIATTSSYYATKDGIRVGRSVPSLRSRAELADALRKHEFVEIRPSVYTWHDFAVDFPTGSFCLRDENAATQLTIRPGISTHLGAVWITDARFVSYLPATVAEPLGMQPREIFCASKPLEP